MNIKQSVDLLEDLGFIINKQKSSLAPKTRCKYLGFIIDSIRYSVELTDKKKAQVNHLLRNIKLGMKYKIQKIAHIIGVLISCCPGTAYGNVYCKRLERQKWLALLANNNIFEGAITINNALWEDITWWLKNARVGINPIRIRRFKTTLSSEAFRTGWGAENNGRTAHGRTTRQLLRV